jgi:hypothetical protein
MPGRKVVMADPRCFWISKPNDHYVVSHLWRLLMKKTLVLTGSMLALSASLATAAGINLAWNDCGTNGVISASFPCNTNSGAPFQLFASFIPPAGLNEFLGLSAQIDITTGTPSLVDWWAVGTGQCRQGGLSTDFNFVAGPFSCADFYAGAAAGGFAYDAGYGTPNRGRLRVQCAVPFDNRGPVDSGTEYYALRVLLTRAKTTGATTCAGCPEPACIVLNEVQLFQPPAAQNDPVLTAPANSNYALWQATAIPGCPLSTPSRKSSWGQVKSLYR